MKFREDEIASTSAPDSTCLTKEERRDFLKKCGRFAAYTTPVVMALLCYDEAKASNVTSKPPT